MEAIAVRPNYHREFTMISQPADRIACPVD
jgi:hypothetical protein